MLTEEVFLSQLGQLIGCQTLPGNVEENSGALDLVVSWIDKKAKIKRVKNGKAEILIVASTDSLSPDVAYMAHIDVVAGKPDQFKMKVEGDKLIGRGTSDMKFSVPIGVALLNEFVSTDTAKSFALVITTDEEVGGPEGAKYLVNEMKFMPKLLIVPDGGDNLIFVNKAKGVCQITINSKGMPAHASRPWMGKNALEPLVKLATGLVDEYGETNKNESWLTTMNIGVVSGGISSNQVCPEAVMKLDFRFPETESVEKIFGKVKAMAEKIDKTLVISLASTGQPTFTDESLPVVKDFIEKIEKAVGQKVEVKPTYGASDARWFSDQRVPVLMIKPIGGEIHSDDEWISLSSSMKFFEGIRNFLIGLQ